MLPKENPTQMNSTIHQFKIGQRVGFELNPNWRTPTKSTRGIIEAIEENGRYRVHTDDCYTVFLSSVEISHLIELNGKEIEFRIGRDGGPNAEIFWSNDWPALFDAERAGDKRLSSRWVGEPRTMWSHKSLLWIGESV
jgi:hypothetical protein